MGSDYFLLGILATYWKSLITLTYTYFLLSNSTPWRKCDHINRRVQNNANLFVYRPIRYEQGWRETTLSWMGLIVLLQKCY